MNMSLHGVSHIGLSTLDLDLTTSFHEGALGFRLVTIEQIDVEEGGRIRHAFFDCGDGAAQRGAEAAVDTAAACRPVARTRPLLTLV
jgi:catechol 2,3-dioxygenase-like lactoylglutathione lyase family enzyme